MVRKVKEGKQVVRLKGGDPSIFGRLKEEATALQKENIPFHVIPGVSALNGTTISADLLLTARGVNQAFLTATATTETIGNQHLEDYARTKFPAVFFMGLKQLDLLVATYLKEGWSPETPIALIHHSFETKTIRSSLQDIVKGFSEKPIPSPVLICIGDFASVQNSITSPRLPLKDRNILLPGVKESVNNLSKVIFNYGGNAIPWPLVLLEPIDFSDAQKDDIKNADLIILTSPSSVRIFFKQLVFYKLNLKSNVQFAVTGPGTNDVLRQHGHVATIVPEFDFSSVGLLSVLEKTNTKDKNILFPHSQKGGKAIKEAFAKNKHFKSFSLYENQTNALKKPLPNFDTILFTSPSGITNFLSLYDSQLLQNKTIGVIGKITNEEAERQQLPVTFVSQNSTTEGLVKALISSFFEG